MASYPAPTEELPIFSPSVFNTNDIPLTIEEGQKYFITYPTAQGAITIPTLTTGTLNVSGTLTTTKDSHNLGYGYQALSAAVDGSAVDNTAFGYQALKALTLGDSNTAVGDLALPILTGVSANTVRNTAVGHQSGRFLAEGTDNTFVGFNAGAGTSSRIGCNFNTAVGSGAGGILSTGDNNVCVGWGAGDVITTGSNNTCIGYNADVNNLGASFRTAIGSGSVANTDNTITLGRPNSDRVELNYITPMYSSLPFASLTSTSIGYTETVSITFSATSGTQLGFSASLPAGIWLFQSRCFFQTGTFGANEGSFLIKTGYTAGTPASGTIHYAVPIVKSSGTYTGLAMGLSVFTGTPAVVGVVSDYGGASTLTGFSGSVSLTRIA